MKEKFHESDRILFATTRFNLWQFAHRHGRIIYSFIFALLVSSIVFLIAAAIFYQKGFAAGTKESLNTRNPSMELEMACLGLWIGEQNKKYYEKNK